MSQNKVLKAIDVAMNEQKAVRRCLVVWAMCVATYSIYQFFEHFVLFTDTHNLVIGAVMGFMTLILRHYFTSRASEDAGRS